MGGLRKDLPITYWTFLIGALSIAGVPLLSGFFSKDEILYRTFAGGHTLLWLLAIATSFLTAVYMFRLVFLTFHGERATAPAAGNAGHGHPSHLHDAPKPMAFALVILAVGSVLAGYVGVPHVLGGSNRIEEFLAPNLDVGAEVGTHADPAADARADADAAHASGDQTILELTLMGVSTVVGLSGIGVAALFFLRNRRAADALAERFSGVRTLLENKYYVDEIYDAAFVRPTRILSERGLWKVVDVGAIDGLVNGVARAVGSLSFVLRRLQTGSVRTYAASLFLGAVMVLGYYLWK